MQMQKLSLHFPSPSSDLGNSLSTTSTEMVLDMTRTCPFIFQTTQSPFSFKVLDSYMIVHLLLMTVHLQLFQILLLFHRNNNNNKLWNANTVIELAIWRITILIFIHVSTVIKPVILRTDASETNVLQEQRFILDGSLLGNGHQQPRRYSNTCQNLFPNIEQSCSWVFSIFSPCIWQGGKWWSSTSFKATSSEPEPQPATPVSEL